MQWFKNFFKKKEKTEEIKDRFDSGVITIKYDARTGDTQTLVNITDRSRVGAKVLAYLLMQMEYGICVQNVYEEIKNLPETEENIKFLYTLADEVAKAREVYVQHIQKAEQEIEKTTDNTAVKASEVFRYTK